eukprot:CAMPEP_0117418916 /NCGR_PEP_ID=MMETSP0758-20121206/599_1 /TAXON_ID=63605 /ORGANISM="Percolomonas cosmopolitus, Strain AE-1 (ATCC 50343)" /LENGTH=115 /DNA_ID=CAMNT_0005199701 /DNA_START=798 /DNA_END=1142 /DNA_ORIENTATION=+
MPALHTIYSALANVLRMTTTKYLESQQINKRAPSLYIIHHLFTRLSDNRSSAKITPYQLLSMKIQEYETCMEEEGSREKLLKAIQQLKDDKENKLANLPQLEEKENMSSEEKRQR